MNAIKPFIFNVAGFAAVGLGIIGIFLPLLPTTPFLLLAAFCFLRGSRKFHSWLVNHRILGAYIRDYLGRKIIPVKAKIYTLAILWFSIGLSSFLVKKLPIILVLTAIALIVSIHILSLKSRPPSPFIKGTGESRKSNDERKTLIQRRNPSSKTRRDDRRRNIDSR